MVSRKLNKRRNKRRNKRNTRQKKGKKQTSKVIKCKTCNKQIKMTKRNYKKIKDAGNLKYVCNMLCCGVNSDAIEQSKIKPINEKNLNFFKFNEEGRYEPLPPWQADDREKMKMLMNSNKVDGWTIAPPQPVMLYDSNKKLEPVYRTLKGSDDVDLETMPFYNTPKIKELPIVGNLGEKRSTRAAVKKVKPDKNQTAKKKKRRISVPMLRF